MVKHIHSQVQKMIDHASKLEAIEQKCPYCDSIISASKFKNRNGDNGDCPSCENRVHMAYPMFGPSIPFYTKAERE